MTLSSCVDALPGVQGLLGASGEVLGASAGWRAMTYAGVLPGVLHGWLQTGLVGGRFPLGGDTWSWEARPVEANTGWLVVLHPEPDQGRERSYHAIFHAQFQFIGLLSPDGTLLEANASALTFAGLKPSDVIGKKLWDTSWWAYAPEVAGSVRDAVRRAALGEVVRYDVEVRGTSGPAPIDFSLKPLYDAEGRVEFLLPEGRDISDLKRQQQQFVMQSIVLASYAERLRELHRLSTTEYSNMHDVLDDCLRTGCLLFGMETGVLNEFTSGECVFRAIHPGHGELRTGASFSLSEMLCAEVILREETVMYHDTWEQPGLLTHPAVTRLGIRAYLGTPVFVRGELYGVLFFASTQPGVPFTPHDRDLVEMLAQRIQRLVETTLNREDLDRSERLVNRALRIARMGAWDYDPHAGTISWSPEMYEIFGVPLGTPITYDIYLGTLPAEERDRVQGIITSSIAARESYAFEHAVQHPDGSRRAVYSMAEIIFRSDGTFYLSGVVRDITEEAQARAQIESSEVRYRTLTQNITDLITRHRSDGTLLDVSAASLALLGYTPEEVMPLRVSDLVHAPHRDAVREAFARVSEEPLVMEIQLLRKDGTPVWVECRAHAVQDPASGERHIFATTRSVEERHREDELRQKREARMRLLFRITSRTATSVDAQFADALRLAAGEVGFESAAVLRLSPDLDFAFVRVFYGPAHLAPDTPLPLAPGARLRLPLGGLQVLRSEDEAIDLFELDPHPIPLNTLAVLPLDPGGKVAYLLCFWNHTEGLHRFDEGREEFVRLLGLWIRATLERDAAEQELRASRNLLSSLLSSSRDGIMALDALRNEAGEVVNFRWILVNPEAERLTGRSRESLVGSLLLNQMPGNRETGLFDLYRQVVQERVVKEQTLHYRHDGLDAWLHLVAVPLGDGFFVTFRDVTTQKVAEQQLRQSEEHFRLLAEHASDLIALFDSAGCFVYCSDSTQRLTGYDTRHLLGAPLSAFVHEQDQNCMGPDVFFPEQEGVTVRTNFRFLHRDGKYRWFEAACRRLPEGPYRTAAPFQAALRDVTERVLGEQERTRITRQLEERNKELQDFAYVASHDLQEPLRKIRTFSGLMKQDFGDNIDEMARFYLDRIHSSAERMSRLISDLLAFSRVSTQGQPFSRVDLNRTVAEVLQDLEIAVQESGAELHLAPLPEVVGDATQLRQLLQNLIGNALKFRHPGVPPRIHLYSQTEPGPPGYVDVFVRDEGIGFDEKYTERIFKPFQRLHTRDAYEGTGMGLAICKRIADRHRGQLSAQSRPDEGATFILRLPLDVPHPATPEQPPA